MTLSEMPSRLMARLMRLSEMPRSEPASARDESQARSAWPTRS